MITVKDVTIKYRKTRRTIYNWIEAGAPFEKIGKTWYLKSYEELDQWLIKTYK